MIWPAIVQQFQVKPSEADKEEPYIEDNIDATRAAYDLEDVEVRRRTRRRRRRRPGADALSRQTAHGPAGRPEAGPRRRSSSCQQVRAYYSVAPRARRRPLRRSTARRRRWCSASASSTRRGIADADRNWSNLHTVYTHGDGVIAAYANRDRRHDDGQRRIVWAEGIESGAGRPAAVSTAATRSRIYFGEQSPDYSVVGKAGEDATNVELEPPRRRRGRGRATTTTTYDGEGGVADRRHLQPADVRREVRRAELPAVRPGQRQQQGALQPRAASSGSRRSRRG